MIHPVSSQHPIYHHGRLHSRVIQFCYEMVRVNTENQKENAKSNENFENSIIRIDAGLV